MFFRLTVISRRALEFGPVNVATDMNKPVKNQGIRFRDSKLLWTGALTFLVGSGPLLVSLLAEAQGLTRDPNPNRVGFGILAMLTFWPGIAMMAAGVISVLAWRGELRQARKCLPGDTDRQ